VVKLYLGSLRASLLAVSRGAKIVIVVLVVIFVTLLWLSLQTLSGSTN
jgi:hypothetical protein